MKKTIFRFKVVSFRSIETPFQKKGYKNYYSVVDVKDLPDLEEWREINVRDPKLTGSVPRKITDSFHDNPELFVYMNRGVLLSVESITFDNKTSEVEITMANRDIHGLGDGGHTYTIIRNEAKNLKETTQYVKLEFVEGFSLEDIALIVEGRNTSNQVKDQSLMELTKKFEDLKHHLEKKYIDKISFSEFERDSSGEPKPVDIREIIALMTVLNKDLYTDGVQPVIAYTSKKACLDRFKQSPKSYEKLYPIINEILQLHDHIYDRFERIYTEASKNAGKSRGRFGGITGITKYDTVADGPILYFLNKQIIYNIPSAFIFPLLASFRAFIEEKDGVYVWGKGIRPLDLLDSDLAVRLVGFIIDEALKNQNPTKTGKSTLLWQTCYQNAELYYLKMK